jgi:hypothetical protein
MSRTTFNDSQIQNRNYLSPIGFKFTLVSKEKVDFFSNTAKVPGITLGTALQPSSLRILDIPGTELVYEDFTMNFLVDENLQNYMVIHNWLTGLGFPQSMEQFKNLTTNDDGLEDKKLQYCDGTLHILNSNYIDVVRVKFVDLFPISLTPLEFTATDTDVNYFTAQVSFKYTAYTVLDTNGDPL